MIRVTSQGMIDNGHSGATAHHYDIAQKRMVFQAAVPRLKAYEVGPASSNFSSLLNSTVNQKHLNENNAELKYRGLADFNLDFAEVSYWRKNEIAQIDVSGQAVCQIDFEKDHIHVLNDKPFDDKLNLQVVMGPALILLLSVTKNYCLHASAVVTPQGCFAMLAEPGAAEPTLSAHIDSSWSQLADDILPLEFIDDIELIHQYPQLKLSNACISERPVKPVFLKCIFRVSQEPAPHTEFNELERTDALLQIVRHTVAARLFDHKMMREHASFAKRLTGHIPTIELSYSHDLSKLDELRGDITDFVAGLS